MSCGLRLWSILRIYLDSHALYCSKALESIHNKSVDKKILSHNSFNYLLLGCWHPTKDYYIFFDFCISIMKIYKSETNSANLMYCISVIVVFAFKFCSCSFYIIDSTGNWNVENSPKIEQWVIIVVICFKS